tara:strand:+ start:893 stop:1807 length:915 start_codon:yes stop_codon:yes gene_type:complete
MNQKLYAIPRMGSYTSLIINGLRELGLNMIDTPLITEKTIKLGVKHSPEMICMPFKVTLGTFIECVENGATDLIMWNQCGTCRFRQYYKIQDLIMKELGYKFNMHIVRPRHLLSDLKKLNKNNSYLKISNTIRKNWDEIKQMENNYNSEINAENINIGLVGEIYTLLEPKVNNDIIHKLRKYKVKVHTFVNVIHLVKASFGLELFKFKEARGYLDGGELGGHAVHNIKDTLFFTRNNIDGIVHVMPLTCMPESTIEPILNEICYDAKIPLLRIYIDETNSELNLETRLETFTELIKRKKCEIVI